MNATLLLYPVFVLVGLTFLLLVWTGRARVAAVRRGEVKVADIALGQRAWPARITQVSNTYQNQLELPVLFYVLVALASVHPRTVDLALVVLAWGFVASRLVHAYVYTTSNAIFWRFNAFLAGVALLLAMWAIFAYRIVAG